MPGAPADVHVLPGGVPGVLDGVLGVPDARMGVRYGVIGGHASVSCTRAGVLLRIKK